MLTTGREIKTKQDRNGSFERAMDGTKLGFDNKGASINNIVSVSAPTKKQEKVESKTTIGKANSKLRVTDSYANKVKKNAVAGVGSKEKMTTRNIVMVCCYCLVVVALVSVIALNASALSTITEKNNVLQGENAELLSTYTNLGTELSALANPTRLTELAHNSLNMAAADANVKVVEMSVSTVLDRPVVVPTTNWFDSMCDSISSVFGG